MTDRYYISYIRIPHGCCYDICIRDRQFAHEYNRGEFEHICECVDLAIAEKIVELLNRTEP